jgi:predicted kinase
MKTLILMSGIPGSGKSTWCQRYAASHPHTHIIDTDETRKKLTGSYLVFPEKMETIFDDMIEEANHVFQSGEADCTVIEDSPFLDDYRRLYYMKRIHGYDKAILFMIKFHDYSICYQRNRLRIKEKWVPDHVIDEMIRQYQDPSKEVAALFDEIKIEWWN